MENCNQAFIYSDLNKYCIRYVSTIRQQKHTNYNTVARQIMRYAPEIEKA